MVYGHIEALRGCPAHKDTGKVPGHIWTPEWSPGTYGHRKGAKANMGTERVPEHLWEEKGTALEHIGTRRFPGTYGQLKGTQEHVSTGNVPGHIWAPEWCPDT